MNDWSAREPVESTPAGQPDPDAPEVWAGVECSVARIGDRYFDQIERSGHDARISDLDLIADLGIRALRYPVLWERTAPEGLDRADWRWAEERLERIRRRIIRPIVGLVHHGSGPRHTSLIDPGFPEALAEYALAVASRFPWVEDYTPVNEPLTTARFSGLYGFWYPHHRDDPSFCRAMLNQCRGVVLAMRAIRSVNPAARLVQTEDLSLIQSTPQLAYQADFENHRRWLTFDLLCGSVGPEHPMWSYLRWAGVAEADIAWFQDHPCPPDLLGLNHYLTSERFLDHRVERYPPECRGSNGWQAYADVETVRVGTARRQGLRHLLGEAWRRYRRPLAITEAHLGCTREDQVRWLLEVWESARGARADGADVRAVTAWAVLGSYDWNSLLTRLDGHYEPGCWDLRSQPPRPTALARLTRELAAGQPPRHPVLAECGWWDNPARFLHLSDDDSSGRAPASLHGLGPAPVGEVRPIVVTGSGGTLGRAFLRACALRGLAHRGFTRGELDITDPAAVATALDAARAWAVVNAAGRAGTHEAERDPHGFLRVHAEGSAVLAEACARRGIRLVSLSSEQVFGEPRRGRPFVESEPVGPSSHLGRCHAELERRVREASPDALVIRTAACFGPPDGRGSLARALHHLRLGRPVAIPGEHPVSPAYLPDLANAALELLVDGETGIWHLVNDGPATLGELVRTAAALCGLDASRLRIRPAVDEGHRRSAALASERAALMPGLESALRRFAEDWRRTAHEAAPQPPPGLAAPLLEGDPLRPAPGIVAEWTVPQGEAW